MTLQDRFVRFLRHLEEATRTGRLVWTETADVDTFRATFDKGMVLLSKEESKAKVSVDVPPEDGRFPCEYRAALVNAYDTLVVEYSERPDKHSFLGEFHELARESALRPVELLNSLEEEVSRLLHTSASH